MKTRSSPTGTVRILLIQRDLIGGIHLRIAIQMSGLRPNLRVIESGLDAVRATCDDIRSGEAAPELILAELDLGQESHRGVLRTVRRSDPLDQVPLIVIGEAGKPANDRWAQRLGAQGFVGGPDRASDLLRAGNEIASTWSRLEAERSRRWTSGAGAAPHPRLDPRLEEISTRAAGLSELSTVAPGTAKSRRRPGR